MARIIYDSELDESLKDIKEDVSPDYSAFNDEIPPPPPINIKGYGKNLIVETAPGSGKYKTQWGEEASDEYVRDIEDTLASDMSDEQLSAKIRKQVPQRPDDAKLAAWETKLKFRQMALESMKDHGLEVPDPWLEGEKAASEMKKHYYQGVSVHDQLLRTEKENAKINFDIEQARKIAVHNAKARIDSFIAQIDDHYEKMSTAEAKAPTDDKRIENALTAQLGRRPTDAEFIAEKQRMAVEVASAKAKATEQGKAEGQKGMLSENTLQQAYEYVKTKGEFPPEVNRLFRVPGAQIEVMDYVSKRMAEDGGSGENRVVQGAIQKSLNSSLTFQEKQRGAMGSFVSNINRQIDRIGELEKSVIQRVGVRALDMPIRELKTRFAGSGYERALESYTKEVSAEISKLVQGSQASIQQLPVEVQKAWDRIHDPNLSWAELKKVLDTTRRQANDRLKATDDEISFTQEKLRGYRRKDSNAENGGIPSRPKTWKRINGVWKQG